jgi:hypothetical protein
MIIGFDYFSRPYFDRPALSFGEEIELATSLCLPLDV